MTFIANDNMNGFNDNLSPRVILSFLLRTTITTITTITTTTRLDLKLYFLVIYLSESFPLRTWSKVQLIDSNHIHIMG